MKKRKNLLLKSVWSFVLFLVLVLLSLVFFEFFYPSFVTGQSVREIDIKDECSVMFDRVLHQIKSEGNCATMCRNECSSISLEMDDFDFKKNDDRCNDCVCYCG